MFTKLREKRIQKGYTNQKLAEKLGISKTFYYQIETGSRKLSYDIATKIADIFNVKLDALFYSNFAGQKVKKISFFLFLFIKIWYINVIKYEE